MYIRKILEIHKNHVKAETSLTATGPALIADFMLTNSNNKASWHCLQTNFQIVNTSLADALTSITVGATKYLSEAGTIK